MTENRKVKAFVEESAILLQPNQIYWCDGSLAEATQLMEELVLQNKAIRLNQSLRPGCYLFRSDPSDVARVENRTFIASIDEKDAGPTNNWVHPDELKATMRQFFRGSMKGRTMYVIPFSMGPIGSHFSKIGIQITDSPYVVLNMRIMTRMGKSVLELLDQGSDFVPCLHSIGYPLNEGEMDPLWPCAPIEQKYISHFPEEKLIWSYGSGYGGNALLGKKCFSLRIASFIAKEEGWLAEHMLIIKVTNPLGRVKYFTGAFPSACGKTNLSMMVPSIPGWKVETIGDDIAWIKIGPDGRLYATNPEAGFFGVAPGTSVFSNPNAMKCIQKDTIFTNVALTDEGDVWWEGLTKSTPKHLIDWQGNDWNQASSSKAAHPNSRFTASIQNCPCISSNWEDTNGVPISAILFGGRRPDTIPLVLESTSWEHGVFLGSIMGSEMTAATISNEIGNVRRDPFAMKPFIGYHVCDYFNHWLSFTNRTKEELLPKIYMVNWFQKDQEGQFLWPGFGENARVLQWIFERCDQQVDTISTPIGKIPNPRDLNLDGLHISKNRFEQLFNIDPTSWKKEVTSIHNYYQSLGSTLPKVLKEQLEKLETYYT
ncbi:MAG: phosphoenolpyruvate carboxykinase (GTP) [bacterium]|nr:phosphoenolpyruvate carboxykinase (GTP) [bacterium]